MAGYNCLFANTPLTLFQYKYNTDNDVLQRLSLLKSANTAVPQCMMGIVLVTLLTLLELIVG